MIRKTTLAEHHPEIAAQLHPTKNNGTTAEQITAGSGKKYWWVCDNGEDHVWSSRVIDRTRGSGCPFCLGRQASTTNNLALLHPNIAKQLHPTKNGAVTAEQIPAGSAGRYWWVCEVDTDHEWEATVINRTRGGGCVHCSASWTLMRLRAFVRALLPFIAVLTKAEVYTVLRQNGMLGSSKNAFARTLLAGSVPTEELEQFAEGSPSILDESAGADSSEETAHNGADAAAAEDTTLSPEELALVEAATAGEPTLPAVAAKTALAAAASGLFASCDEEAVEFLVASGVEKIWKSAYADPGTTLAETAVPQENEYSERIRVEFRRQYDTAKALVIPSGYDFRPGGAGTPVAEPNLMQRHIAADVRDRRRVGNWSGTGAGKTLSAVLASRVLGAEFTVVCCPNSVVGCEASATTRGSGWVHAIKTTYPDSRVITKTLTPIWNKGRGPRYLVLNYETLQQNDSESKLEALLDAENVDFVVVDEIHYAKQRNEKEMSMRKRLVQALISTAGEKNHELAVLGMSATPVINNLQEGKSLVELITATEHPDLGTRVSLANAMALHQRLVTLGSRWVPSYSMSYEQIELDVDCSGWLDELKALGKTPHAQAIEAVLTKARLPHIIAQLQPKTVIYTHYVEGIVEPIEKAIKDAGWTVGRYTGDDKTGLEEFVNGDLDVLIGTATIGTGVDGLQQVCSHMVVNSLPWTAAEFEQLKGRLFRQGQTRNKVTVVIPRTYANVNGEEWSWCKSRIDRIRWKKALADAAVDGVVPAGELVSQEAATKALMGWLNRLENGETKTIERTPITVPLNVSITENKGRIAKYGEFSEMNHRWNCSNSSTTNDRLRNDPGEWAQYHTLYREARQKWVVVPYEKLAGELLRMRTGKIVGDLGCGEAGLAKLIGDHHTVYSFDHIAIDETVVACDISAVPMEDGCFDVAVLCLSLMGKNSAKYVQEAHRLLDLGGQLRIVERSKRVGDVNAFQDKLATLGFDVASIETVEPFLFVTAVRADRRSCALLSDLL